MTDTRLFRDGGDGPIYRVSIHPHELAVGEGISPWVRTVIFEDIMTGRIISAPVHSAWELGEITDRDLKLLLDRGVH